MTALSRTPEPLRRALQQSGLASAAILRNHKRDSAMALKLGYEDKGTASEEQVSTAAGITTALGGTMTLGGTTARVDDSASSAYFPPLHSYPSQPVVAPSVSAVLGVQVWEQMWLNAWTMVHYRWHSVRTQQWTWET